MMGEETLLTNQELRKAMMLIEKGRFKRARRVIEREDTHAVDTGNIFVGLRDSARYCYASALIWLLQNKDAAWEADRERAEDASGWTPKLEVDTLYEYATLLIRHKWRPDKVEELLQEILDHPTSTRVLRTRTQTEWGKFFYGQKQYDEAHKHFDKALNEWTAIQERPGRILDATEKSWMTEANWLLLKTLAKLRADKKEIDPLACWAIWHDHSMSHKFTAARLRIGRRKTINE